MSSDKGTVHVFKLSVGDIKVLPLDKVPTATLVSAGRPKLAWRVQYPSVQAQTHGSEVAIDHLRAGSGAVGSS